MILIILEFMEVFTKLNYNNSYYVAHTVLENPIQSAGAGWAPTCRGEQASDIRKTPHFEKQVKGG